MSASVSERLVAFARAWGKAGVPAHVLHETKRLILNQLKASVGAVNHKTINILHDWARGSDDGGRAAHILWRGTEATPAHAAVVNGALFEVLDFHDTYIPCFMHATSAVLPAVLALAEVRSSPGNRVVEALALGLEIELAIATILMPTGYYRGYVPAGLTGGVGAAAACAILADLDDQSFRNAIGIAMCSAFGNYVSVGSDTLSYITGATARSGYTAFELAARGLDAPRTAFEGDKGMFETHCDENKDKIASVLDTLGTTWRTLGQTYKVVPTETITHAPIELALAVLSRAGTRHVEKMTLGVEQIVVKIVKERMERFGRPTSDLTARFDLCFCVAAAWHRGRFTLDEMAEPAYSDAEILGLRDRIELVADPERKTFEGAWLEVAFTDGTTERANVDAFLGTPNNRMSDHQLADLFCSAAEPIMPEPNARRIVSVTMNLDKVQNISELMSQLTIGTGG